MFLLVLIELTCHEYVHVLEVARQLYVSRLVSKPVIRVRTCVLFLDGEASESAASELSDGGGVAV